METLRFRVQYKEDPINRIRSEEETQEGEIKKATRRHNTIGFRINPND